MKKVFILLAIISLFSCNTNSRNNDLYADSQSQTKANKKEVINQTNKKQLVDSNTTTPHKNKILDSIQLNTFTSIPIDIQGCVCYFYLSESDKKKAKYIMVENFADRGYLSLNGKMERFNLVDFKDNVFYLYTDGIYNLKIEFKNRVDTGNESFTVKGTLTLSKNGIILIRNEFIGEYSC